MGVIRSDADNWLADVERLVLYTRADLSLSYRERSKKPYSMTVHPRPHVDIEDIRSALRVQYPDRVFAAVWHGTSLHIRRIDA